MARPRRDLVGIPPRRLRRLLPWVLLVGLLAVAQSLLLALTVAHESDRLQDDAEAAAIEGAAGLRRELLRLEQAVQALAWQPAPEPPATAAELLRARPALRHLEWRDPHMAVIGTVESPVGTALFGQLARREAQVETVEACEAALRGPSPRFSASYFVPLPEGRGAEVVDLCVPLQHAGAPSGFVVATVALGAVLDDVASASGMRRHELSLVEADGARLARAGASRGAGVYVASRVVDLPGRPLLLRTDGVAGRPSLIPNLALALVFGLSIALFAVVLLLAHDVRRRTRAEAALAEAYGLRKAMEESLSTGLRARDMDGCIRYANPAFCRMVGWSLQELQAAAAPPARPPFWPPYWPPEHAADYAARQAARLAGVGDRGEAHAGFETVFMRRSGERFPVMIYEAPLLDGDGRQTGWMSSVLDVSAQRGIEELARQQQERLQASARLATVGEMASLLSHELNQPLAAIASYAVGSLNLLDATPGTPGVPASRQVPGGDPDLPALRALLRPALQRIAEQAERAGRVIKSVHDFVRRREQPREALSAEMLLDDMLPLVRLQARKSGTRVETDLPAPPLPMPRVMCDRTMVEQVLLNLARNGIQAMAADTPPAQRLLSIRVRAQPPDRVRFEVADAGPGIAPEVAPRLFTPFFTTRAEGMGLGLSLCRTVIEQHGGALAFAPGPEGRGTVFAFTLPAARPAGTIGRGPDDGAGDHNSATSAAP